MPAQHAFDPVPPHDLQAERAVLGAMLLDAEDAATALARLTEDDFYRSAHRVIFKGLRTLVDQAHVPDELVLRDHLEQTGELDQAGGLEGLRDIARDVTSGAFIEEHMQLIQDKAVRRGVVKACKLSLSDAINPGVSTKELVENVESRIMGVTQERGSTGPRPFSQAIDAALAELERELQPGAPQLGLESGHMNIDNLTGGWRPGEFIVVAGRPSDGKSTLAMNWVIHAAELLDCHTLWFSLEMPDRQIARNSLSMMTGLETHTNQVRQLDEQALQKLRGAAQAARALPIELDDSGGLTISQLRARARRCHLRWPLGLIVVDYLTLVTGQRHKGGTRAEEVGNISQGLKRLSRELDAPVLAMAQLKRDADGREPRLSDLKESGDIEQDADKVLFIWKDKGNPACVKISVAKNRNGPTGTTTLRFDREHMKFVQPGVD